jgi:hypothetical protein
MAAIDQIFASPSCGVKHPVHAAPKYCILAIRLTDTGTALSNLSLTPSYLAAVIYEADTCILSLLHMHAAGQKFALSGSIASSPIPSQLTHTMIPPSCLSAAITESFDI